MSKTKIVVVHLKEIVYTVVFVALGILLILLLVFMFLGKQDISTPTYAAQESTEQQYVAGVYTSSIKLNDNTLNIEVVVDTNHINSVRLLNIDETISTMYPLVEPSLSEIEEQLLNGTSIDQIEYSDDSKYTQMLLVDAIKETLDKATLVTVTD